MKFGKEGERLRSWLEERLTGLENAGPLIERLCATTDRLEEISTMLKDKKLTTVEKSSLIALESRLNGTWTRLYKILVPPPTEEGYGQVGRPTEFERRQRKLGA